MKKAFLINLGIILLINLLVKPLYIFGIDITVQNRLGPGTYGLYFALLNFTFLFQIINDAGLHIYNTRLTATRPQAILYHLGAFIRLKGLLAILFLVVIVAIGWLMGYLVNGYLLLLIAVNQILVSLIIYLRSNIAALGLFRTDSLLSALDKLLLILFCGYLLWLTADGFNFTIIHFVYAQLASLIITAMVAGTIIHRKARSDLQMEEGKSEVKQILKAAWPYALSVFLMTIYTRIDGVMIEQLLPDGNYQAGVYAAGYRLLDAVNMIAFLFTPLLLPMFRKVAGNAAELKALLKTAFEIMLLLCVNCTVLAFFYRNEIISFLYTDAEGSWATVFGLLILSFIPIGLMYIFGTLQVSIYPIKRLNRLYLTCVFLNILLNVLLIPHYKAGGAAIATLTTQSLATALLILFSFRELKPWLSVTYGFRCAGFVVSIVLWVFLLRSYLVFDPLINLLVMLAGLPVLSAVFGFLNYGKIRNFLLGAFSKSRIDG